MKDMTGEHAKATRIKAILQSHAQELHSAGILHLDLHGSVARDEATADSDVDLIADFDRAKALSLFDLVGLQLRLSGMLNASVDLSDRRFLKDEIRQRSAQDAVVVF
ncbi:MAG TPA: nucleotidyltransferase domain-containing protein [Bryobacteraceae bacterium]|nr:nucleotidyltransferase domain-containing protein [Bryobacteraceae bacterium]